MLISGLATFVSNALVIRPDYENMEEPANAITNFFRPGPKEAGKDRPAYFKQMKVDRVVSLFA